MISHDLVLMSDEVSFLKHQGVSRRLAAIPLAAGSQIVLDFLREEVLFERRDRAMAVSVFGRQPARTLRAECASGSARISRSQVAPRLDDEAAVKQGGKVVPGGPCAARLESGSPVFTGDLRPDAIPSRVTALPACAGAETPPVLPRSAFMTGPSVSRT